MRAKRHRVPALLATMALTIALSGAALGQTPAQQQPTPEVLEYTGLVAAAREVEIAPRLDGLLSKINFAAGQLVKEGDLLFEFAVSGRFGPRDSENTEDHAAGLNVTTVRPSQGGSS